MIKKLNLSIGFLTLSLLAWIFGLAMFSAAIGTILYKLQTAKSSASPFNTEILTSHYSFPRFYGITVIYEISTIFITFSIDVGHDLLFVSMMLELCAQVSMIKHRFKSMINNIKNKYENNITIDSFERVKIEKNVINNFIEYHLEILHLADKISCVFSIEMFMQFALSGIFICVLAFQLSVTQLFSSGFFSAACVLSAALSQAAIICIVSDEVKIQVG